MKWISLWYWSQKGSVLDRPHLQRMYGFSTSNFFSSFQTDEYPASSRVIRCTESGIPPNTWYGPFLQTWIRCSGNPVFFCPFPGVSFPVSPSESLIAGLSLTVFSPRKRSVLRVCIPSLPVFINFSWKNNRWETKHSFPPAD